ncbi:MAG: phosphoenolpyruvate carboxykinase (ATP) [Actinomycetota bacterium]
MEATLSSDGSSAGAAWRWNLSVPELIEISVARGESKLARSGALAAYTGAHTGRSPKDRFIVAHGASRGHIDWGGFNQPIDVEAFDALLVRAQVHLDGRELFVVDGYVGADPAHTIKVRVIAEYAWHALFARQLFRRPDPRELATFEPEFTLVSAPTFEPLPARDGTRSSTFVGLDLERRKVLICGTEYAGEMKKSIFSAANYLLPMAGVLTMHCSANIDPQGRVALFFGLSGTGKTTLSADEGRALIGDDEHGWSDNGIFNLEGGCYAKCIDLSAEKEPQIYAAIGFGSMLENVVLDGGRNELYDDGSLTENTRAVYPLEFIPGFVEEGRAGHASSVVFLTADAFGVLPPVSVLERKGAMYHFLSGFTSKLAGTEVGLGAEPEATFSTCFGAPFLPLPPVTYAEMLAERIDRHGAKVFMVNTGWTGGPYGEGQRIDLATTRRIVRAATEGALDEIATKRDPIFNLDVPVSCPGVPDQVLDPRSTWASEDAYEAQARALAQRFQKNFESFAGAVPAGVEGAGPELT